MVAKGFKGKYFSLAAIAATVSMVVLNAKAANVAEVEKVVVSASKYEEPIEEITEDIEVITSEEIEERGLKSLKDLLRYVNGASLTSNGGDGKTSSLYLRGLDNSKVLILLDGVRFYDPSNINGASFEHILLDSVEKVEIIKGAQSGIWGADSSSGVINIITKKAKKLQASMKLEKGSFNTDNLSFFISAKKRFFYNISYNYFQTDGVSAITPYNKNPKDYERDGYINRTLSIKGGYDFENIFFEIGGRFINADNEADGYNLITYQPDPDSKNDDTFKYNSAFLNSSYKIDTHKISIHLDKTSTKREFLDTTWGVNFYKGKTRKAEINDRFVLHNSTFLIGADYNGFDTFYKEVFGSSDRMSYNSKGVYFINKNRFDKAILSLNLRYDNYSSFKDQTTGKIGFKYNLTESFKFFANYSKAYNVPNQMKILNPWGRSNFFLQPETTYSYDLGLSFKEFKVTLFEERVKNLIDWYDPDSAIWGDEYYKNFDKKSRFKGLELSYEKDFFENLLINLGFTYLSAKDGNKEDLPRRAKTKYSYSLTWYPTDKHTININGYYVGKRYDDRLKTRQTGKYNVTNISLSHQFAKNFQGFIKIDNIFDKRYQEVYGYGGKPRAFYIGIKGKFN